MPSKVTLLGFHWYQEILLEALRQDWHLLKHLGPTKKLDRLLRFFLGSTVESVGN